MTTFYRLCKPNGRPVNLYVAYYSSQRNGYSPHSPLVCIPGGGWLITGLTRTSFDGPGGALPLIASSLRRMESSTGVLLVRRAWAEHHKRVLGKMVSTGRCDFKEPDRRIPDPANDRNIPRRNRARRRAASAIILCATSCHAWDRTCLLNTKTQQRPPYIAAPAAMDSSSHASLC